MRGGTAGLRHRRRALRLLCLLHLLCLLCMVCLQMPPCLLGASPPAHCFPCLPPAANAGVGGDYEPRSLRLLRRGGTFISLRAGHSFASILASTLKGCVAGRRVGRTTGAPALAATRAPAPAPYAASSGRCCAWGPHYISSSVAPNGAQLVQVGVLWQWSRAVSIALPPTAGRPGIEAAPLPPPPAGGQALGRGQAQGRCAGGAAAGARRVSEPQWALPPPPVQCMTARLHPWLSAPNRLSPHPTGRPTT